MNAAVYYDPSNHRVRSTIGDYIISSTIGHGSSGRVRLGIHQISGHKVALKIIPRHHLKLSTKRAQAVERELAVLQLLHHPNLIDLVQVLQDEDNVYFVTEYVPGGELYDVLSDKGRLSEPEARNIFGQLVSALSWCHTRSICHRDLKLENILLDQNRANIKIADFGMATLQSGNALLKTSCGSPHYASPEIIRGIPYYGPSADVWSAGVILYTLLTGKLPFDDRHIGRLLAKIKTGRFKKIPDWVSPIARDLIYRILVVDPSQRIRSNDILSHPWMIPYSSSCTSHNAAEEFIASATSSTMLSIHSFSLQWNPWHDEQLKYPLILSSGDLHGATRETLKVLWRDLSHDQIVSALMEAKPNLHKLIYQLLQQRLKKQNNQSIIQRRSTDSLEERRLLDICDSSKFLMSSTTTLSQQCPSSYSYNTELTACDKNSIQTNDNFTPTKELLSSSSRLALDDDFCNYVNEKAVVNRSFSLSSALLPTSTISANNNPQAQPNSKTTRTNYIDSLLYVTPPKYYPDGIIDPKKHYFSISRTTTLSNTKILMTPQTSFLSALSIPPSLPKKAYRPETALAKLLSGQKWTTYLVSIQNRQDQSRAQYQKRLDDAIICLKNKYHQLLSVFFTIYCGKTEKEKHLRRIVRQEVSILCMAKTEFIAAGKLQYILSHHFDGRLNGCMYPDGKVLWSGEINKSSLDNDTTMSKQTEDDNGRICFLCKIQYVSDSSSRQLYKIIFITHREDSLLVSLFAHRLTDILVIYGRDSDEVLTVNKWIQ